MGEIIQTIIYLGSIQGLLLSIFLFSIKTNKLSNRLLALLTLLWGLFLLVFALQEEGLYLKYPHLLKVFYQFLFLFFPLLYLQVKYLLARHTRFYKEDLFHFFPFLLSILFYSDFYLQSGEDKIYMIRNRTEYYEILQIIGDEVIALQGVLYSIFSLILIRRYRKKIKEYESTVDKNIIRILFAGISLNLFSWIIGITGIHLDYLQIETGVDLFAIAYLVLVIVIYIISYAAVKSPEVFKLDLNTIQKTPVTIGSLVKPFKESNKEDQDKNIPDDQSEEIKIDPSNVSINEHLIKVMEIDKPYLNPELSLPELAKDLDIPRNQLSGVINQIHQKNFFEFVNQYRVNEVKQLMSDPSNKHLKLISLGYDAGFNSKASFFRIFKQITEMTPSQYMESLQNK